MIWHLPLLILKIIELSAEEHELLKHPAIAGVILFSCNYEEDPSRLRSLTSKIKKQMLHFGQIYSSDPGQTKTALQRKLTIT